MRHSRREELIRKYRSWEGPPLKISRVERVVDLQSRPDTRRSLRPLLLFERRHGSLRGLLLVLVAQRLGRTRAA
jgi:hypothetical protein